jgi:hypothetical protein
MVQQIWSKLNLRERMAAIGAGLIVLSWLLGIVLSSGLYGVAGAGGVGLLGAIAVLVVVYLRYAPNTTVTWPAPYATILLGISAVVALIALLQLLQLVSVFWAPGGLWRCHGRPRPARRLGGRGAHAVGLLPGMAECQGDAGLRGRARPPVGLMRRYFSHRLTCCWLDTV